MEGENKFPSVKKVHGMKRIDGICISIPGKRGLEIVPWGTTESSGPQLGLCRRFGPWWPSATACDARRQAAVLPLCRVACMMSHQKPRKSVNQSQARLYPPQPRKPSGEWGCLQCTLERTVKSFSTSSVKWPVLMHADPRTHCSHCAWLNSAVRDDGGSTHAGCTFGEVKILALKKKRKMELVT